MVSLEFVAYIHYYRGGKAQALEDLKKAIRINPDIGFAHSSIGELYREKGDVRMAEAAYAKALEIDPNDEIAVTGLKRLRRLKR
jgi:tetratricopeptide (TPR) repeat protein